MSKFETTGESMTAEAVKEITRLATASIEHSTKALLSHNSDAIKEEFSAGFSMAGGDWRVSSRDELIKKISSGHLKYESIKTEVEHITVPTNSVAIVSGNRSVKAVVDGKDFASTFPFKAVHALEGGRWRTVLLAVNC